MTALTFTWRIEIMERLRQWRRSRGGDFNLGLPEKEAGLLMKS
jgi:hypothetical protein